MSEPTRREKIEAMLAEDPKDEFLRYGLALEMEKEGRHEDSVAALRALIADSPHYVAAHFMAAQQLVKLGRPEEAKPLLREGIEVARQQCDTHTADEMADFLSALGEQ